MCGMGFCLIRRKHSQFARLLSPAQCAWKRFRWRRQKAADIEEWGAAGSGAEARTAAAVVAEAVGTPQAEARTAGEAGAAEDEAAQAEAV